MTGPGEKEYQRILNSAILAPSADNRDQFRFEIARASIRVWYRGFMPAPQGYQRALLLLSLGALSENITLESQAIGWLAKFALFPDPVRPELALEVEWMPRDACRDPLLDAIPRRHTNRRLSYHGPGLRPAVLESLRLVASQRPDACSLHWIESGEQRKRALKLVQLAETERFRNPALHRELFSSIRFDVGWTQTCERGLPPGALEVEKPLRPFFKLLRHWPVMQALNLVGFHRLMGFRAGRLPCSLAPHLGLIAVRNTDEQSIFAAGRTFQKLWLALTQLDFSLQPFPAAAIYALNGATHEHVSANLQQVLAQGWREILGDFVPVMLFRAGRATKPSLRTSRPTLESFME